MVAGTAVQLWSLSRNNNNNNGNNLLSAFHVPGTTRAISRFLYKSMSSLYTAFKSQNQDSNTDLSESKACALNKHKIQS